MSPLDTYTQTVNLIQEEKWQRFSEWQEREEIMAAPRLPLRQRLMRAGGDKLVALGRRMQESAGMPLAGELANPC